MVGVLRNPVTVEYLKKNAAVGAISQALDIGKAFSQCKNGAEFVAFLEEHYDAKVLTRGKITNYELKMDGGYDIGHLDVTGEEGSVSFTFWNEYMLAEQNGQRVATFPDLICTLDAAPARPSPQPRQRTAWTPTPS